jgi:hypothetical protein
MSCTSSPQIALLILILSIGGQNARGPAKVQTRYRFYFSKNIKKGVDKVFRVPAAGS